MSTMHRISMYLEANIFYLDDLLSTTINKAPHVQVCIIKQSF